MLSQESVYPWGTVPGEGAHKEYSIILVVFYFFIWVMVIHVYVKIQQAIHLFLHLTALMCYTSMKFTNKNYTQEKNGRMYKLKVGKTFL